MPYFESEYATVEYDESLDAVIGKPHEYVEGEEFREYMDAIIDGIRDADTDKMLADTREMGPVVQEDQTWSVTDWAHRAEDAGMEYMAFVMPERVISKLSVESVIDQTQDDIERAFFEDPMGARSWLREQADVEGEADSRRIE